MKQELRILVVEDNPADADFIREMLPQQGPVKFHIEPAARLAEAVTRLERKDIDLVLLDLGLPDSQGLATFQKLRQVVPDVPVIVLSGANNEELAIAAVREGAQDYLVKGLVGGSLLIRAILHALVRHKTEMQRRWSETQLQATLEATAAGILAIDNQGKLIKSNHRFADIWQVPPSVLESRDDQRLLAFVLDQLADPEEFMKKVEALYASDAMDTDTILFKDGRILERYSAPMFMSGKIMGRVWSFRDITKRVEVEKSLLRRQQILQAVGLAAEQLLRAPNWRDTILKVLASLGEATGVSRVVVWQAHDGKDGARLISQLYEWFSGGLASRVEDLTVKNLPLVASGFGRWGKVLGSGMAIQGLVRDLPASEQPALKFHQILSIAVVPIMVDNQWWGFMAFDECRQERGWRVDEIEALQAAARILGEAIQREQVEKSLYDSEWRFRDMVQNIPAVAVQSYGYDGITHYWNAASEKLYGYTAAEAIGKNLLDLVVPPETRAGVQSAIQHMAETGQAIPASELILMRKDGSRVAVFSSHSIVQVPGRSPELFCIDIDLTERKQAEEKLSASERDFRNLAEAMPQIVWATRPDGWNIYLNPQWVDYTGMSLEESYGHGWSKPFHPDDQQRARDAWQNAVLYNGNYSLECRLRRADGTYRWWLVRGLPQRDENGKIFKWFGTCTDIEAIKQAELALRASEENYRQLFSTMLDGFAVHEIICDAAGRPVDYRFLSVNPSFERLTGLRAAEVIGRTVREVMPGTEPSQIERYGRVALTGEPQVFEEYSAPLKKYFEISAFQSQTGRFATVFLDITARKQAEAALRESQERYQSLFDHSRDCVFLHDFAGNILDVNQAMLDLLGFQREDIPALKLDSLLTEEQFQLAFRTIETIRVTGRQESPTEFQVRGKNGRQIDVETRSSLIYHHGQPYAILGIARDLTERKRAEATHIRLATAVEQAAETIFITDTQGAILYANPAFEQSTGYPRAEVMGQNPRLLKSGKQDGAFYRQMWDALKRGEVWHGHFVNKHKDGTLYEEEATISPIRDAAGKIINFVAVKRDVTHEMELEGQLRQSQKMEAVGTLAGGIAHDFNNILNVIFGYCNLLQLDLEGKPEELEKLSEILKAGERAKNLVQQILTFSRQREQERQVIRLNTIIKETIKLLRASLPANIQIETELAADAPMVLADATQIYQVVMNLGTNALHAMGGAAPGRLTITLDAFEPDAAFILRRPELRAIRYARLTATDTGCGMDARTLAHIYDPFFTTKPIGKGTGLGLAVVHGIVEAHDGVITVESQPGQGTTFCLYFPEQIPDMFLAGIPEDLIACGQGERILMVDDELALAGMYQKLLKALKYEGTVVTSPGEAIRLVRENPAQFDLVITDLTMPEMNGLEAACQIHALRADLPIILATGFKGTVTDQQLRDVDICEVVEKPISMAALATVLRGILGKNNS